MDFNSWKMKETWIEKVKRLWGRVTGRNVYCTHFDEGTEDYSVETAFEVNRKTGVYTVMSNKIIKK